MEMEAPFDWLLVGFDVQLIQPLSFDVYIFLKEISKQATLT